MHSPTAIDGARPSLAQLAQHRPRAGRVQTNAPAAEAFVKLTLMGQPPGLRRPLRPPGTGPRVFLGFSGETGRDRIVFDAPLYALELFAAPNQSVIALVPPKGLACRLEQSVGSPAGSSLERAEKLRRAHKRRNQQMDVVRHDHPRVTLIVSQLDAMFD